MGFLRTILNFLFPASCLSCGKRDEELCAECLASFPKAERESEKWIFPLFDYRHPQLKKAIWLLKYKGRKGLAGIFAKALYAPLLEELGDFAVMENFFSPILIPVPLSNKRYRERGFNQAELIAEELLKLLAENKTFRLETGVLIKPRDTEHQARIENRSDRLKNIIGSFAAKNIGRIKNKNIILIDDVTTTGATLSEAKKVLKNAGARKIIAFTVAH